MQQLKCENRIVIRQALRSTFPDSWMKAKIQFFTGGCHSHRKQGGESCDHLRMLNPIMGAAILIFFLPAKRWVLPFY